MEMGWAADIPRVKTRTIPPEKRINNFREVDLALTEEEALAEAERCLRCGVCSECLECVKVCDAGAIDHEMEDRVIEVKKMGLVFNRVQGNEEQLKRAAKDIGLKVFGYIPQDENIAYFDLIGKSLLRLPGESPALSAVGSVVANHIVHLEN
jgi:MinD superfamily P-loop ATPase